MSATQTSSTVTNRVHTLPARAAAATTVATKVETVPTGHLCCARPRREEPTTVKFVAYQQFGHDLFGPAPTIQLALKNHDPLFHEAAVFIPAPDHDALFVTSNQFVPEGSDAKTIRIHKLTRKRAAAGGATWTSESIPGCHDLMGNGAVNYPSMDSVLLCAQGTSQHPGGLFTMMTERPFCVKPLLTSFHGRIFNSTNDVIVAKDGAIWFTDPNYGHEQGIRRKPQLPCQVYRYDPLSEDVRVVAHGFGKPNGLCLSPNEDTMYITDTDYIHGDGDLNDSRASHIYAFTVEMIYGSPFLTNRRVFAMADTGVPDGIKCDMDGNVYSGCGDGVSIWRPNGVLVAKIMVPGGVANFCFGRPGELLLLNETKFWVAQIAKNVRGALLDGMGISVE